MRKIAEVLTESARELLELASAFGCKETLDEIALSDDVDNFLLHMRMAKTNFTNSMDNIETTIQLRRDELQG